MNDSTEPKMELNLQQIQGLKILLEGVVIAQKSGVYSLKDASVLHQAVSLFVQPKEEVVAED